MSFGDFNVREYWDAATNKPPLRSGRGDPGRGYYVAVAGTTNLDGNAIWNVGDIAVFILDQWVRFTNWSAGGAITIRQLVTGLAGLGLYYDAQAAIPGTIDDPITLQWQKGQFVYPGDPLSELLRTALGYTAPAWTALLSGFASSVKP